jgi:hypothetical protein
MRHEDESAFMESAAEIIGLPIPTEFAEGVRMHLERIAQMAAPLLAISIPDDVESAPVFEP